MTGRDKKTVSRAGVFGMSKGEEIAIIRMAGRFPGAGDVEAFWRNIRDGVESITFFSYDELLAEGVSPDHLATRASYKLDLKGPAVAVQTACFTSLTAVHTACRSLLGNECDFPDGSL